MKTDYKALLFVKRFKDVLSNNQRTMVFLHYTPKEIVSTNPFTKSKKIPYPDTSICSRLIGKPLGRFIRETEELLQSLKKGK
ncbi:hypothetical protein [uncultured Bacteroides sp.]|uniref:hypothetical protein n=1 Tax=uncultured Bacteroides sp. TaxID=162156 RepID=UPI002AABD0F5|nr:hypothetical protein [uncultured Bacteroides sp.]